MKLLHALAYVAETAAAVALGMTATTLFLAGVVMKARQRMMRRR